MPLSILAQGSIAEPIMDLISFSMVLILPITLFTWIVFFKSPRPRSSAVHTAAAVTLIALLICAAAAYEKFTRPTVEEQLALEAVMSSDPDLDSATFTHTIKEITHNVFIVSLNGLTRAGRPFNHTYRVNQSTVDRADPNAPSGWTTVKHW